MGSIIIGFLGQIINSFEPTSHGSETFARIKRDSEKNFAKFLRKYLWRVSFLIKLQAEPATLLKKDTPIQMISCEFWKFFRTPFL